MTSSNEDNRNFMTDQIITYLGNKRKILTHISKCLDIIEEREGEKQLTMADAFSGSGIVGRLLKTRTSHLYVNDCAGYSETLNKCFLANPNKDFIKNVEKYINQANELADKNVLHEEDEWISKHWSPKGEIKPEHRVYFTEQNGRRIDIIRNFIDTIPEKYKPFLLGPLLVEASIHNNTNGQFTAFYKDGDIGAFGGSKGNDLHRITAPIYLKSPVLLSNNSKIHVDRDDANEWITGLPDIDVLYLDPPYNKHPYCIYYFLLDIINDWDKTVEIPDSYRGQPKNWIKSAYNSSRHAISAFKHLIENAPAKYILLSYNDEGIIPIDTLESIMDQHGTVEKIPIDHKVYNRLRGIADYKREKEARNVKEFIWMLTKK
jgi:adenine-specific DNA-methyltransferase